MKIISNLDFNNIAKVVNATDPSSAQDGATKTYSSTNIARTSPVLNIYTGSSTWTKPAGCKKIKVIVVGGGGNGGGAQDSVGANPAAGGGGGGGGTAISWIDVTGYATGTNISVTVGAAGGNSLFNTVLSGTYVQGSAGANGTTTDVGGSGNTVASGGAGGSGVIALGTGYIISGSSGTNGANYGSSGMKGGDGGSTLLSAKKLGAYRISSGTADGSTGYLYGGGGSGGAEIGGNVANGGAGAAGIVIVEEYY